MRGGGGGNLSLSHFSRHVIIVKMPNSCFNIKYTCIADKIW